MVLKVDLIVIVYFIILRGFNKFHIRWYEIILLRIKIVVKRNDTVMYYIKDKICITLLETQITFINKILCNF